MLPTLVLKLQPLKTILVSETELSKYNTPLKVFDVLFIKFESSITKLNYLTDFMSAYSNPKEASDTFLFPEIIAPFI